MRDGNPAPVTRLTDYRPPAWLVDHTRLDVDLRDGHATKIKFPPHGNLVILGRLDEG